VLIFERINFAPAPRTEGGMFAQGALFGALWRNRQLLL
jgi:hypothetical protein